MRNKLGNAYTYSTNYYTHTHTHTHMNQPVQKPGQSFFTVFTAKIRIENPTRCHSVSKCYFIFI